MRHYQLQDHVIAAHIISRYGPGLEIDHLEQTAERRFRAIREDGTNVVINAYVVGPNNAGQYRHWLAMPKPAWGRVDGEKPVGWEHYILMVGLLPDGATIWWSVLYDEAKVAASNTEPDYPRSGYGRLRPDQVKHAIAGGPYDEVQMEMFAEAPPTCDHEYQCVHCGYRMDSGIDVG